MSDFCKQCSLHMFGEDFHDLSGLISKEKVDDGYGARVICERCGLIMIDHLGERIKSLPEGSSETFIKVSVADEVDFTLEDKENETD